MALFQNGIDVSRYQGSINWPQVAAGGQQFAIIRLGSSNNGGLYVDPYFLQNVNGAWAPITTPMHAARAPLPMS